MRLLIINWSLINPCYQQTCLIKQDAQLKLNTGWTTDFFKDFIYLYLERGRDRNRDVQDRHRSVASHAPPTGDQAHNPGMCPDWESNQRPFGSQTSTRSTEPQQKISEPDFFKYIPHNIMLILNNDRSSKIQL